MDAPGEMEQARGDQPRTCRLPPLPWRGPASARGSTTMQGWSQLAKVWWVCQGMARWPREHGNWRCTPPVGRNVWPVRHCLDFTFISFPFLFILNWFCFFCITVGFEPQDGRRWPWPRHGLIKVNGDTHSQKVRRQGHQEGGQGHLSAAMTAPSSSSTPGAASPRSLVGAEVPEIVS